MLPILLGKFFKHLSQCRAIGSNSLLFPIATQTNLNFGYTICEDASADSLGCPWSNIGRVTMLVPLLNDGWRFISLDNSFCLILEPDPDRLSTHHGQQHIAESSYIIPSASREGLLHFVHWWQLQFHRRQLWRCPRVYPHSPWSLHPAIVLQHRLDNAWSNLWPSIEALRQ